MARPRLFLVDSFNFIFRAFHARQRSGAPPMRNSRGSSTEAVYIFHNMLRRLVRQYQPEYLAAAYESEGPTFRDAQFEAYKATRTETPPELIEQIPMVERLLVAMRIPVLKVPGYEADDIIGTLCKRSGELGVDAWIISSDKDMLQLVDERTRMLDPMKNDAIYDPEKVKEFKGVRPEQIADLLGLVGDTVDNIPGAPGIGEKGAVALLEQYGSIENLIAHAGEITAKRQRESLQNFTGQILLSKSLATIATDAPVDVTLDELAVGEPDREALASIYRELEFFSFLKEMGADEKAGEQPPDIGPTPEADPDRLVVYDWKLHLREGAEADGKQVEDVLLYAFLLLSDPGAVAFDSLMARYLDRPMDRDEALPRIAARLRPQVTGELRALYDEIDLPLAAVLARMERTGIRVDPEQLQRLSARMETEVSRLTDEIFALAGTPFNLNSPQQLGKVLFEEMGLPSQGRTGKTKSYSTAADVLESLATDFPIAQKVLDYRQIAKLKGTYVDALPALMTDSRVHTTFNQAGAATGRLSSSNPNLQNIPVRTELGREIRAAFVPEPGWTLLAADYSQIELRLLAHFSGDAVLVDAFRNNEDIHTRTAAEVFGVPPLMVSPEMRRNAKAVNFGIVYGQTSFGLASQLGITKGEAELYIRGYFERYAGVKKWIDKTIAEVRDTGYTRTLHGRRRSIPDIGAKNPNARSFAERTAVNTPLQGTASDLIKIAMIRIDEELRRSGMRTRMLLQVHDELVFECPGEEVREASKLVKRLMEGVAQLKVPLLADTGTGANWRDAK